VVGISYLVGSLPLTQIAAWALRRVDLRTVGNGTVSGTGLYEVTGFGPLAVVGVLELAKGSIGPLLAGPDRSYTRAAAAGAAVAGHNWSPFLRLAGGRGLTPAMGAALIAAPEGTAWLAAGLVIGRLAGETALGCFAAIVTLPAALAGFRGRAGLATGAALAGPMLLKRVMGNAPAAGPGRRHVYVLRLLLDRDSRQPAALAARGG
jgi:glycerol-3-phosphate acyltransferase PlsY